MANTQASGACGRKSLRVQVPLCPQNIKSQNEVFNKTKLWKKIH